MATNTEKSTRRRGRPSKAEELQAAMRALAIDPRSVDPLAVLAGIMMDPALPASARVQAARALIAARDAERPEDHSPAAGDAVSVRAQQLLAARRKAN